MNNVETAALVAALYWPASRLLQWSIRKGYQTARNLPWYAYRMAWHACVFTTVFYPDTWLAHHLEPRLQSLLAGQHPAWHPLVAITNRHLGRWNG